MTEPAHSETVPKGLWQAAKFAAARTPKQRNRSADLYRAVSILFVVMGHWLLVAPQITGGEVHLTLLLAEVRWTQYATWVFQVMPVFFFVGGYSNAASWTSARNDPAKRHDWASKRLFRLLLPIQPLVLVWAIAAVAAKLGGLEPDLIDAASQAALLPVWFLAVYIVITIFVPVFFPVWDRLGPASVLLLAGGAIAVDAIGFGLGQGWLRWTNYGFIWLAVHQMGFWWYSPRHKTPSPWLLALIGVVWMAILIKGLGFPVSLISVPGEEISNTRPPTTAMLAIGCVQIGLLLAVEKPVHRWLAKVKVWAAVIFVNQIIMTVYLWHITAVITLLGLSWAAGGIGLSRLPGTAEWWAYRPLWIALLVVVLVGFVATFLRFEAASKKSKQAQPGYGWAFTGALTASAGLVMFSLNGIGATHALGFNLYAVVLVLVGVRIATTLLPWQA